MKDRVGHYRIAKLLGHGAMGSAYAADDEREKRRVALKVVKRGPDGDVDLERFQRESQGLTTVSHPNVATVFETGVADGVAFVALELVAGTDLKRWVEQRGPLPWTTAARIGAEIADGLEAIHLSGFMHRNLKPSNVLIDQRERPRLSDFGLSRGPGALEYASPDEKLDDRSDLYSLGVVLFEMLTGDCPFSGTGPELVQKHASARPMSPRTLVAEIPEKLEALVLRLLAKKPDDRPRTAGEVASELRSIEGTAVVEKPGSRRGVTIAALALVVAAALLYWTQRPPKHPATAPARNDLDAALDETARAIEVDPANFEWWRSRGLILRATGDLAGAERDLTRAIELGATSKKPDWVDALAVRGLVRRDLGRRRDARADLEMACELAPGNAEYRSYLEALGD